MINNLIEYFSNKKIIILGFGKEGQSTYKFIRKYLKEQQLYVADIKEKFYDNYEYLNDDKYVSFIDGDKYLDNLEEYDIIMKTPGISFVNVDTSKYLCKIKSQLELLLEFFNIFTIGITGTKGKSTTSSLIYKILSDQNIKSVLLGNIGVPIFDYIDSFEDDTVLVLEMSSHQLEYVDRSPNIAILLNIYEEHLDHYKSFEDYVYAKCNIFRYQNKSDYLLYNIEDKILSKFVKNVKSKMLGVSFNNIGKSDIYLDTGNVYYNGDIIYNKDEPRNLLGNYNLSNIMYALGVAEILNLDRKKTIESISNFKTLEHRLEFVGNYNDILYYDNSIGTIPEATIEAIKALEHVDTLIIGGMDRGIDYTEFIHYLSNSNISNIICMPKTGHDIAKNLNNKKCFIVDTLEEAVKVSKQVTKKGDICLLSPAAASYGYFKNFEEKGNLYKKMVQENY